MSVITRDEAIKRIYATKGRLFGVEFVKRSTGTIRKMVCRLGVRSRLQGGSAAYDFVAKGLLSVFDVTAWSRSGHPFIVRGAYRSVPVEGIVAITVGGERYSVGDDWEGE